MTLDKPQRRELEKVVTRMRSRIEDDVEYQVKEIYGLDNGEEAPTGLDDEELETRERLMEAVEREAVDGHSWEEALKLYVKGTGYTVVNRLAALRCMEVRGLDVPNVEHGDRAVTRLREDGLTPAAEPLIENFEVEGREEGILEAYRRACDGMEQEIEILFDHDGPYSVVDPDFDTFEDLLEMLDEVDGSIWAADDVLGWVYEYYNAQQLDEMDVNDLDTVDEVSVANQFYTPHWVVRMLTDNSLGKLYLEKTGELEETLEAQEQFSPEERKDRENDPDSAPTLTELSTYLVPSEAGEPTEFDDPSEIRVIDPACGSGHFLLYAFDLLERIWWKERPDLDRADVPAEILKHNLHGVDIDMRATQLATFNLYLKARARTEAEGDEFHMPRVGIVCADARIADLENTEQVFDEVAGDRTHVREALDTILDAFTDVHGLGSLLDVKGTLEDLFSPGQRKISDDWSGDHSLQSFLKSLRNEIGKHQDGESFLAQDLRSFLRLLLVLSQNYDVALMNPPYGMRGRMPDKVKKYVKEQYRYYPDFYVNFFEVCERLSKTNGRVGMLVPWSFMFRKVFEDFRVDFVGEDRHFDFLSEFGYDILDNATVGTVGTVVQIGASGKEKGTFIRLHDVPKGAKELKFATAAFSDAYDGEIQRRFTRDTSEFSIVPGASVSYWVPKELRQLYDSETVLDAENAELDGKESVGVVKQGLATGDDDRFFRYYWEVRNENEVFPPISKGGRNAWLLPKINRTVLWKGGGEEVRRYAGSYPRNTDLYFSEGVTFNSRKRSGRNFGYMHPDSVFSHVGTAIFPDDMDAWPLIAYLNSRLVTYLKLAQTFERKWEISTVARLPVIDAVFEQKDELAETAKEQVANVLAKRSTQFTSPHFSGSLIAQMVDHDFNYPSEHPHRTLLDDIPWTPPSQVGNDSTFEEMAVRAEQFLEELDEDLERVAQDTDELLFDSIGIDDELRREVLREVGLRTIDDPLADRKALDNGEARTETQNASKQSLVKDFLLQLGLEILSEDDDGIVLLRNESDEEENALLSRIEEKFEEIFEEYAEERLEEADRILDSRGSGGREGPYPDLEAWLEEELFEFHTSTFENTPILWKITTENLVADPDGEGFACLVDYHELDENTFQRLTSRYLETREKVLREKRNAANQRRNDSTLSAEERGEATEEYERCTDGLRQIEEFKGVIKDLAKPDPRDWSEEDRRKAENLAPKVREFREGLELRMDTFEKLAETTSEKWIRDKFTPTFLETLNEEKDEWIDALRDIEYACVEYADDGSNSVEAHLYDLFPYVSKIMGKNSYRSRNRILWAYYYFADRGVKYLDDDGEPQKNLLDEERLLAELAEDLDREVKLGEEIKKSCDLLKKKIPSDWETRALEEVTCAGYRPNKKHGVRINITPLAEAGIVPGIVEDKVL